MKYSNQPRISFVKKPRKTRLTIDNSVRISRVSRNDTSLLTQVSQSRKNLDASKFSISSSSIEKKRRIIQLGDVQALYRSSRVSSNFKQYRISPILNNNIREKTTTQEPNDMHRRPTDHSEQSFDSFMKIFRYRGEEEEERSKKRRRRRGIFFKTPECCCLCIGATIAGLILLGALIAAIALIAKNSAASTTTSTTTASTTTSSTTVTTTTTSDTTTTTSVTTTTTTSTVSTTTSTSSTSSTSSTTTTSTTSTTSSTATTTTTSETTTTTSVTITTTSVTTTTSSTATTTTTSETTTTTGVTTDTTSVTTTTTETTTTQTTTTTSKTTTTTSASTIPTTSFNTCNGIKWNKTGILVAGDGSSGNSASKLNKPRCVYVDANDTVYVCDTENHRIQKWPKGASTGTTVSSGLNKPLGLTFDASGNMYVADTENCRVAKFIPPSTTDITVAGTSGSCGNSNNQLDKPSGVAIDSSGKLYVTDTNSNRVMRYNSGSTTGTPVLTSVNSPYGIMFRNNSSNQVYISRTSTKLLELWTLGASTPDATLGTSSNFNEPKQIAIDWYGNVYVTDEQNDRIQMFCTGSSTINTIADGGSGYTPSLDEQTGVAFDSDMNLYVTSATPSGVYKFMRI